MEINDKSLSFSRRAEVALNRLQEQDRDRVLNNIKKVFDLGLRVPHAAPLKGMKNTYLIKSGRDLRIIFEVDSKSIYVLDIVRHDKLAHLSRLTRK